MVYIESQTRNSLLPPCQKWCIARYQWDSYRPGKFIDREIGNIVISLLYIKGTQVYTGDRESCFSPSLTHNPLVFQGVMCFWEVENIDGFRA
jgi:hypothetical protein